jgi:hypothetical protein
MFKCLFLQLHLYAGVRELYYTGCNHAIDEIFYFVNHCNCTINGSFVYAYILCEHNKAFNSYCLNVVKFCVG